MTIPALVREVLAVQAVLVPTPTTAMARLDRPVVLEETHTVILRPRDVLEVSVPVPTTAMDRQAAPAPVVTLDVPGARVVMTLTGAPPPSVITSYVLVY